MMNMFNAAYIVLLFFLCVVIYLHTKQLRESKQRFAEELKLIEKNKRDHQENLMFTKYQLKEVNRLHTSLKTELLKLRTESQFVRKAIRKNVRKQKIRGKRRKSA